MTEIFRKTIAKHVARTTTERLDIVIYERELWRVHAASSQGDRLKMLTGVEPTILELETAAGQTVEPSVRNAHPDGTPREVRIHTATGAVPAVIISSEYLQNGGHRGTFVPVSDTAIRGTAAAPPIVEQSRPLTPTNSGGIFPKRNR